MLVQELLTQLKSSGIVVRLGENGDLAVTAPKGVMTADIARQIKENKQSIVAFLGVSAAQEALAAFPPITPVDRGRFVSISLAQERLWWLEQMFSGIPVHNLLHAYRLRGPLNVAAFEAGLKWVVNRHESLHMRFDVMDGSPVGVIMDDFVASLPLLSLDDVAEAEREDTLQARLREYDQMSFDLSTGPLFRAVLFRLAPEEHVFLFLVHHIIFDGWSADVFWDDLIFAYQTPDPDTIRPSLGIQYVDYAAWQRDWLQSPAAEKELAFWRDTLQEPVEALTLPVSRQASGHLLPYEAQQQPVVVPPALAAQVKTLAQQNKATPFMVLLAAYKATLHAYTGQEDMIVCTPSVGRTTAVLESQVGYFNNILVFRSNLSQDPTFIALLKREKQAVLSANEHQATPFQHLAELPAVRNVPLMRAMFVLQTHLKPPPALPGLQITPVPVQHGYDYADMSLELTEENGAFSGMMWFKSALFEADHMAQFVENYLAVLGVVTAHPERPLSALPRFELPVVMEAAANGKRPFTAPRDAAETELAAIWGEMLAYEPVSVYDNFFDVGGHSLLAIRFFDRIEAVTGVKLPLSLLFRAATIADLAAFVRDDAPELAVSSLVSLTGQDDPAERPFYCATPPGDELLVFHALAQAMGEKRPFIGLQYGVNGEPPIMTVEEMAAYFVRQILEQGSREPYLLGGYCFGGLLAYEMAQQLTAQGKEVALVAMIDTAVPGAVVQKKHTLRDKVNNSVLILQEEGIVAEVQHIVNRTTDRFKLDVWHPLWGKMQKRYVAQDRCLPEALRNYDFINLQAETQYQVKPYAGNVVLAQAEGQYPAYEYAPHLGWDRFVTGALADHVVPGEHRTMLEQPHVLELAAILKTAVDQALS